MSQDYHLRHISKLSKPPNSQSLEVGVITVVISCNDMVQGAELDLDPEGMAKSSWPMVSNRLPAPSRAL
jgi:hypothetical protein